MILLSAIIVFVLGLCVGSFLNVLVFRAREGKPLTGRSRCRSCEIPVAWRDLVPVLSFFLLKGRCRGCRAVVSWQYPLVEAATGALFLGFYLRYAFSWFLPAEATADTLWLWLVRDLIFGVFLIIIFVYDLRYSLILDRFTVPAMIAAVILNLWLGVPGASLLLGAAVLGLFFLAQYLISNGRWVGGGDIRMGALMGFMLGARDGLVALFIAYCLGAVFAVVLLAARKATSKTPVPFGTFLSLGVVIALLFGERIVGWYLGLFA